MSAFKAGDLDAAIKNVSYYIGLVVRNPICTGKVLNAPDLDYLCEQVGKQIAANPSVVETSGDFCEKTCVYVVTKLQASGGHTRLLFNLIKAFPEYRHHVIATHLDSTSELEAVRALGALGHNVSFEAAPISPSYLSKATYLKYAIETMRPEKVFLLAHHHDSVAIVGALAQSYARPYFLHHADHHQALGLHIKRFIHVDLHRPGLHHCTNTLGIDACYLPLTSDPIEVSKLFNGQKSDVGCTTCTAARGNKIRPAYHIHYWEVIPQVLARTNGVHIHVGKLDIWIRGLVSLNLWKNKIPLNKFVYIPYAPSIIEILSKYNVGLYISSFPYAGALTIVEVMSAGVPIAVHKHAITPLLGSRDLAHPFAFEWSRPEQLYDFCASFSSAGALEAGKDATLHHNKYHNPNQIKRFFENAGSQCSETNDCEPGNAIDGCAIAETLFAESNLPSHLQTLLIRLLLDFRAMIFSLRTIFGKR